MAEISVDNGPLYYEIHGADTAPAVVLSNSLGTTLEMWNAQVEALARTHRVICYDTRGHGRSPLNSDKPLTIERLADDIIALLDDIRIERAHVVGLSLGGMAAQSAAVRYPQRIASLVLIATSAFMDARDTWHARAALIRAGGMAAIADGVLSRWFTPRFIETCPELVGRYRRDLMAMDPIGYAACAEAIADMDLRESNTQIVAPTLILVGDSDVSTPIAMSEALQRQIKGARLTVIGHGAHLLAVEQPGPVSAQLQQWLANL